MGNYATNEWECISILSKLIGPTDQFTPTQVAEVLAGGGAVYLETPTGVAFTSFVSVDSFIFSSAIVPTEDSITISLLVGSLINDEWSYG